MNTLHKTLHLQHHRHTGKVLQHRHTSYRGLAMVLVLAGVSMLGISLLSRAAADSLVGINGTLPVAVPASAAVITQPTSATTVQSTHLWVAGDCPMVSPQVVIDITVDGTLAGSGRCDSRNVFAVAITLAAGSHSLVAKTSTITGASGPDSTPVTITYQAMSVQSSSAPATTPIIITPATNFSYLGASTTASWDGTISGGTPPYQLRIDWGDGGQYGLLAGRQPYSHNYDHLESYNATVFATDSTGLTASQQFAVAAYTSADTSTIALASNVTASGSGGASRFSSSTVFGLYGLFLSVASVSAIIYLEARPHRHEVFVVG